jgi:hypothetical protein
MSCFDDFIILVQSLVPETSQASSGGEPKLMLTTP